MIVLLHHFFLMFYEPFISGKSLLAYLLYPFTAGYESVMLFFLLSGFVLSLPFLRGVSQPYNQFLRRRVLRIYGPYLGALALSVAGCALWHNRLASIGWASGTWSSPVDLHSLLQHLAFLGSYNDAKYNTVFWSLVHEMRISIIFPFLYYFVKRAKLGQVLLLILILQLAGQIPFYPRLMETVQYTGIFAIGILLAKNISTIHEWFEHLGVFSRVGLAIASFTLYFGGLKFASKWRLDSIVIALGATGFMIFALHSNRVRNALLTRVPLFLGTISYSLYLVHGTVLFAMASVLKGKISPPAFFVLFLPTSILLSWCFYTAVEAPFTKMSRRIGKPSSTLLPVSVPSAD